VRPRPPRLRYRSGLALVALIAGAMLLAAGGSADATARPAISPASSARGPSLCDSIAQLDRLVVRRTDAFPKNLRLFTFADSVTVHQAAAVRAVAKALCALPKMPVGAMLCPADFGITYELAFFAPGRAFPTVGVGATGCQAVHGLGPARWVRSSGFWKVLGRAMGLAHPDDTTFAGRSF